jgi:hypothetical protein
MASTLPELNFITYYSQLKKDFDQYPELLRYLEIIFKSENAEEILNLTDLDNHKLGEMLETLLRFHNAQQEYIVYEQSYKGWYRVKQDIELTFHMDEEETIIITKNSFIDDCSLQIERNGEFLIIDLDKDKLEEVPHFNEEEYSNQIYFSHLF